MIPSPDRRDQGRGASPSALVARVLRTVLVTLSVLAAACAAEDPAPASDDTITSTGGAAETASPQPTSTGPDPGDSTGTPPAGSSSDDGQVDSSTGAPADECPTHIRTTRIASLVNISFGWTGQGHGADPVDGMATSYELFDCDDECRRCRFRGPVPNIPELPNDPRRCLNMFPQQCESDADCGDEEGACQIMFQPPVQRTTSWTAAYAPNLSPAQMEEFDTEFEDGAQGVVNLATGDFDFEILNSRVPLGPGFSEVCTGDTTPDDGQKDGTCADSGDPCDVATISPNGALSFDCAWTPNVIDFALPLHGMGTGGVLWEMDDTRPMCTFPGAETVPCWCGVCADDESLPCQRDSDCPTGTCGNAGTPEGPVITLPNICAPGETCDWDPDAFSGTCMGATGPVSCFPAAGEWAIEGDTAVQEDFFVSTVALLGCLPEVDPERLIIVDMENDISLDEAFGFPGPIIQALPLKVTPEWR
ncbi:MAG: hypothetical protein AAF721_35535 [Myxococcota bacterium]